MADEATSRQWQGTGIPVALAGDIPDGGVPSPAEVSPDSPAYVIYTSGSTGQPKGAILTHRNAVRLFTSTDRLFAFGPDDAWTFFHSVAFDFSVWEIWGALVHGGRLVVVPYAVSRSPEAFLEFLAAEGVTILNQTPSAFRLLDEADAAAGRATRLTLREVIFGGEALDPALLRGWARARGLNSPRLVNMYGITETTVHVTFRPVTEADIRRGGRSPIGVPLPDLEVYILDTRLEPVPVGVPGELCVAGPGLATGYLGRPEMTAERFVASPFPVSRGRLYRSGDLARWLPSGELEYLGRRDDQVKVRGFRIELGEVEAALAAQPGVRAAAVTVETLDGESHLAGHIAADADLDLVPVRRALRELLPAYMLPSRLLAYEQLPLTANGKADRRLLSEHATRTRTTGAAGNPPAAPGDWCANDSERTLLALWTRILDLSRPIGPDDDFFGLGGDSIQAIRMVGAARERGLNISIEQLFIDPSLRGLAARAEAGADSPTTADQTAAAADEQGALGALVPAGVRAVLPDDADEVFPAAALQEGMLFHSRRSPGERRFHNVTAFQLRIAWDPEAFQTAVHGLSRRHPVLRSNFLETEDGLFTVVRRDALIPVHVSDLRGAGAETRETAVDQHLERERVTPLAADQAPLARISVLLTGERELWVVLAEHHSILDGWSVASLLTELFQDYLGQCGQAPSGVPLAAPRSRYADFVAAERRTIADPAAREHWEHVTGGATPTRIGLIPAPDARTEHSDECDVDLPPGTGAGLRALAQRVGVPLRTVLLTAHVAALGLYSGERDVITGEVVNGRIDQADGDRVLGLFLNTVPLRPRLADGDWLAAVRAIARTEQASYPYRRYPLARMGDAASLFDTVFNFTHFHVYNGLRHLPGASLLEVRDFQRTDMALVANFSLDLDSSDVSLRLDADPSRLAPGRVRTIAALYRRVLTVMATRADSPWTAVAAVGDPAERAELLRDSAGPAESLAETGIAASFLARARSCPEQTALIAGRGPVSYRELAAAVAHLTGQLRLHGVQRGQVVGVCLPRSVSSVAAAVAVLAVGAVLLPLDARAPESWLAGLLRRGTARALVTSPDRAPGLAEAAAPLAVIVAEPEAAGSQAAGSETAADDSLTDLAEPGLQEPACLLFTSGSTGVPKGVLLPHRALLNRFSWMWRGLPFEAGEIMVHKTAAGFVDSLWEIFGGLLQGIPTVLLDDAVTEDPRLLVQNLAAAEVSRIVLVPSLLRVLLERYPDLGRRLPRLRWWTVSGEPLPPALAGSFRHAVPGGRLLNLYGSTEVAGDITWADLTSPDADITIGKPIDNAAAFVLDESRRLVPAGVPGRLWVGGDNLALGYAGDPDRTAADFVRAGALALPGSVLFDTGDQARRLAGGELELLGRTDHRLKVRGVRMDPVIIETVLRGLPGVRDAAVGVRRVAGEETLVAYLVGDTAPARAELRATVRAQLPDALIPQLAIRLETLPVTSSGKIDRRALAELPVSPAVPSGGGQADTASPDSVTGQALLELWRSALEEPGLGMHDDVFDHGANSLTVMRVAGQASARLGAEVPVAQLFRCPTAASMAAYLDTAWSNGNPGLPVRRVSVTDRDYDGPLAFTQERLWFLDQLDPGNPAYNVTAALRIDGHVDQEAMRAAVAQLADRHDSLRAVFTVDSGVPAQRVRAPGTPELTALEAHDLRDDLNPDAAAERLLREFAETPFDLGTGPLLRAILIRTAEAGHLFGLNVHHIACDGWSMDVIARDLMLLYVQESTGQPARLPDLPFQFADRAARDRAPEYAPLLEEGLRHWTQALTPEPPALMLPTDHPRPAVPTMRGKVARRSVDAETARVVAEMGRAHDCTLFMTLLAVFAGLLYRRTGQPDLVVGIPIANREPGMEDVVGFCANTLALRLRLDGGSPFGAVLETAREAALDGHTYQATPFEQVIDRLGVTRSTASTPLFQVMFELQESRDNLLGLAGPAGLTVRQMELPTGTSKFDLTLHAERRADGGLDLLLEYSTDLFEPATAEGWLDQYCLLLDNATRLAGCRTDSLPILTADQEAALLRSGRGDVRDWPDASFAGLFARQARLRAAAPAVSDGTTVLSYAELDRRSSAVTAQLQAQGVTPGSVVAISSPRDLFLLPLLLGVIRTGAAFLPLDPGLPAARRSDIVARCRPALVACAGAGLAAAAQLAGIRTADCTAATRGGETGGSGVIADAPVRPGDLAYVLFTSGSTGVPKGVMVDQRGMLNHLHAMVEALGLGAGDTLLQNAAQSFDISVWQMLAPLVYGGTVRIADDDTARDPDALARLLAAEPVQVAEVVPAVLRGLLETFERGGLRPLDTRWLLVTGEAAPGALGRRWSRLLPGIPLVNAYGPAECADDVSLHVRRDDDAPGATVPIGRAVANVRLYVLDGSLQHVPAGSVGELFVGGDAVGRGYVNDPRGTAAVFVPDPFAEQPGQRMYRTGDLVRRHADGTIEFVGREDHQVKVRGFRIELGEVEAALRVAPGVTDAVATAGGATLVGYVVLEPGPGADGERLAAIRAALADQLPGYMVPSVLVRLDSLPLNRSGKVDRKALPEPAATPPGTGSQPGTPAEREVHAVWAELLGGGSFGIDDDFFLIGGHSLLATQVRARIQDRFGVRMTLRAIFEAPTVRQLAAAVQLAQAEILREDELALLLDQIDSMSEQQVQEELDSLQSHP
jgi:amino acid adenylation domain-containing protein